eukprot:s636_g18.t1
MRRGQERVQACPPVSGLPATLLISALAAAILSIGACTFVSIAKKRQPKKRGLLIGESRRSISTDHSGHSSEGSYRSGSDSGSEADLSPVEPPKVHSHPQVSRDRRQPAAAPAPQEQSRRQEEEIRAKMLAENWGKEREREKQRREERRRLLQEQPQNPQPPQPLQQPQPPPKERILCHLD